MSQQLKEFLAEQAAAAIREQRRYEIARDCLAGMVAGEDEINGCYSTKIGVAHAIEFADALLLELEKPQ